MAQAAQMFLEATVPLLLRELSVRAMPAPTTSSHARGAVTTSGSASPRASRGRSPTCRVTLPPSHEHTVPGLASVSATLFALALPAKESTGIMLTFLLIGDAVTLWTYRHAANTAILRHLVPSILTGVGLGALQIAVRTQSQMQRTVGIILLIPIIITLAQRRWVPLALRAERVARAVYGTHVIVTTVIATVQLLM